MEILKRLLPILLLISLPAYGNELPYRVIAYHDVRDDVTEDFDPDQFAVSTANLIDQFTWMRDSGFEPVSVDQIIDAQQGRQPLPDNAVLLTFDDGLVSFYTRVYPLLKLFDYPAVISVVTEWIETRDVVDYADRKLRRKDFLSWEQIREMQDSGIIEVASHSHDLHKGVLGNPQGNTQPAAVTRMYVGDQYEDEAMFLQRINADLSESVSIITEMTGHAPRIITWPYGAYNDLAKSVALKNGLHISLTLDPSTTSNGQEIRLGRFLTVANPNLRDFSSELANELPPPIVRVAQVDLDYVYDPDPEQQSHNLGLLLDRIKALKISHVYLQAFADDDADGGADALYFPNRHLPVRADLFNHVAWQLKTRAEVSVYAWLPLLSYVGGPFVPEWRVLEYRDGAFEPDPESEPRVTPFSPEARERIAEIYEDLATYSRFDGILFHDDGRLSDVEDYSEIALAYYKAQLGEEISPESVADDAELAYRWTDLKARALRDFSSELLVRVRTIHPAAKSARNLFASALLDAAGTNYLAQDFDEYLRTYDYVALMAMPSMEGAKNHRQFYKNLVEAVQRRDEGLNRTIFELQAFDWVELQPIEGEKLRSTMRWLQSLGVRNLGYYPDDFISGQPDFDQLRLGMSLADDLTGVGQ